MRAPNATDYETYREIMGELLSPIMADGLDLDTLKRLYESKAVYLENLRVKCFWELNASGQPTHFTWADYELIRQAIQETRGHLRQLILASMHEHLARRKVS